MCPLREELSRRIKLNIVLIADGGLVGMLRTKYMHRHVALRCAVHVVAAEDAAAHDAALGIVGHDTVLRRAVQVHGSCTHGRRNGGDCRYIAFSALRPHGCCGQTTHAAAIHITGDGAARQVNGRVPRVGQCPAAVDGAADGGDALRHRRAHIQQSTRQQGHIHHSVSESIHIDMLIHFSIFIFSTSHP